MTLPWYGALPRSTIMFPLPFYKITMSATVDGDRKKQMESFNQKTSMDKQSLNAKEAIVSTSKSGSNQVSFSTTEAGITKPSGSVSTSKPFTASPVRTAEAGAEDKPGNSRSGGTRNKTTAKKSISSTTNTGTSPGKGGKAESETDTSAVAEPARHGYKERRAAFRLLERLKTIPEGEWSVKQKHSFSWATRVTEESPRGSEPNPKRQLSDDPPSNPSTLKKPRINKTSPATYSEAVKGQQLWAVVDKSNPDGTISPDNWKKVEARLSSVFFQILKENPGPAPFCRDSGWHQSHVKLIACADQRSTDLYKIAISRIGEVWPGSKFEVISRDDILSLPRARAWLPAEPSDPQRILEMLRVCNPELPTSSWKVTKLDDPKGEYRSATFVVCKDSVDALARSDGVVSYGFSSITLRVYNKDKAPNLKDPVGAEIGPMAESGSGPNTATALRKASADGSISSLLDRVLDTTLTDEEELLASDSDEPNKTVVERKPSNHDVTGSSD
ncbi:uncharacterized protein LOC128863211 [Anastrepha ludens]|uniref:uncharacterized protein LOC128863211 n=1 Tax=Anastrepha ludens TaxID=28586 RepID=UPI0023AF5F7F|nr:uncharacterized protein LOC128863211 [Anastrepha ludens]